MGGVSGEGGGEGKEILVKWLGSKKSSWEQLVSITEERKAAELRRTRANFGRTEEEEGGKEAQGTCVSAVEKKGITWRSVPRREGVSVVEKGAILPKSAQGGSRQRRGRSV